MPRSIRKLIQSLLFLAVLTAGCSRRGSEFVGKWINTTNPCDKFEITRNDQQFFVGKAPATYKKDDGTLQFPFAMGGFFAGASTPATVTYVKSSDTLIVVGVPLAGQQEYKRDLSSESPISSSDFAGKWAGSEIVGGTSTVDIARKGDQFLVSYTLPPQCGLCGGPHTSRYTQVYKDGALRTSGTSWVVRGDPRFPDFLTVTYVSCSDTLVLDNGAGWNRQFGRVK